MSMQVCGQQIVISGANLPSIQLNQETLLGFQLTSTIKRTFSVEFVLNVTDANGNQVLATNGSAIVREGSYSFNSAIRTKRTVVSPMYRQFLNDVGIFPPQEYEACLELNTTEEPVVSFSDCFFADSYPVYDLMLNLPENEQTILLNELPFFQWSFVSPFPLSKVNYSYGLVELQKGQTAPVAIANNPRLLRFSNYALDNYQYQPGNFQLVDGKEYAWSVEAFYQGFLLARAAPFVFKVQNDTATNFIKLTNSYIDVRDASRGNYFVKESIKLRFGSYPNKVLDYTITEVSSGQTISTGKVINEASDDFRVVIDLKKLRLDNKSKYKIVTAEPNSYEVVFTYVGD